MGILGKLQTVFRGDIPIYHLPHELLRRRTAARRLRTERTALDALNEETERLLPEFAKYSPEELLQHFQSDPRPSFRLNNSTHPERALGRADRIADHSNSIAEEAFYLYKCEDLRLDHSLKGKG